MILGIDSDIWFLVRFADKLEETQDKKTAVFKKKKNTPIQSPKYSILRKLIVTEKQKLLKSIIY